MNIPNFKNVKIPKIKREMQNIDTNLSISSISGEITIKLSSIINQMSQIKISTSGTNSTKLVFLLSNYKEVNFYLPIQNVQKFFNPNTFNSNFNVAFKKQFPSSLKSSLFLPLAINISNDLSFSSGPTLNLLEINPFRSFVCLFFGLRFNIKLDECACFPKNQAELNAVSSGIGMNCVNIECKNQLLLNPENFDSLFHGDCSNIAIQAAFTSITAFAGGNITFKDLNLKQTFECIAENSTQAQLETIKETFKKTEQVPQMSLPEPASATTTTTSNKVSVAQDDTPLPVLNTKPVAPLTPKFFIIGPRIENNKKYPIENFVSLNLMFIRNDNSNVAINLFNNDEILIHISIRYFANIIVLNSLIGGWGGEEYIRDINKLRLSNSSNGGLQLDFIKKLEVRENIENYTISVNNLFNYNFKKRSSKSLNFVNISNPSDDSFTILNSIKPIETIGPNLGSANIYKFNTILLNNFVIDFMYYNDIANSDWVNLDYWSNQEVVLQISIRFSSNVIVLSSGNMGQEVVIPNINSFGLKNGLNGGQDINFLKNIRLGFLDLNYNISINNNYNVNYRHINLPSKMINSFRVTGNSNFPDAWLYIVQN